MRLLIPLSLFLLFDLYVFQAFALAATDWPDLTRWLTFMVYWSIPLLGLFVLGSRISTSIKISSKLFTLLRAIVMIAYMSKFLMLGVLALDDIRRLLLSGYESIAGFQGFQLERTVGMAQMAVAIGLVPFLLLMYGVVRNPYRYKVFREKVPVKDLPAALKGLRIVQISDIHSGSFTRKEPIKEAIRLINEEKPDLVFFTGDLVNSIAAEMKPFMDVFDKIKAKYGTFSILGNHDYGDYYAWENHQAKLDNFQALLQTHRDLGWDLMLNENRMLEVNGEKVAVIGVENYSASPRFSKYGDLSKAYAGTEGASLKLLLSHDPTHWDDEVTTKYQDIAITFSGHTHGMQFGIEIPGWLRWSPIKYIYRKWAGLYREGQQYLYVNRGLGFLGYPGRVGILPEITVIEVV